MNLKRKNKLATNPRYTRDTQRKLVCQIIQEDKQTHAHRKFTSKENENTMIKRKPRQKLKIKERDTKPGKSVEEQTSQKKNQKKKPNKKTQRNSLNKNNQELMH